MNITTAIVGLSLYILIWQKLPEWGTLFNTILNRMPKPVRVLYHDWHCPYCVGFWMGLALHAITGLWTLPALAELPAYLGWIGVPLGWFLDALVTGTLMLIGKLTIDAISLPAIQGVVQREAFMLGEKEDEQA